MDATTRNEVAVVERVFDGKVVRQRGSDGYWDATQMCKAAKKKWNDYARTAAAKEFLAELKGSAGIPADVLVQVTTTGDNAGRGTWVHPDIAVHLAQWCSPRVAVQVSRWVRELLATGRVEIRGQQAAGGLKELAAKLAAVEARLAEMQRAAEARPVAVIGAPAYRPVAESATIHDRCVELGAVFTPRDRRRVTTMALGAAWGTSDPPRTTSRRPGAEYVFHGLGIAAVDGVIRHQMRVVAERESARRKATGPGLYDNAD